MEKPREKTKEEVQEEFLNHIRNMVDYWDELPQKSSKERLEGLAFSILAMLDGSAIELPAFIVAPLPCEEDKEFCIEEGRNYFPQNHKIEDKINCDIAGSLHDLWSKKKT